MVFPVPWHRIVPSHSNPPQLTCPISKHRCHQRTRLSSKERRSSSRAKPRRCRGTSQSSGSGKERRWLRWPRWRPGSPSGETGLWSSTRWRRMIRASTCARCPTGLVIRRVLRHILMLNVSIGLFSCRGAVFLNLGTVFSPLQMFLRTVSCYSLQL